MKLRFEDGNCRRQPDPFIFESGGRYYLYVTAHNGVEAYSAPSPFDEWHFEGIVCQVEGWCEYWAPCIMEEDGWFYLYYSCYSDVMPQCLHVSRSRSPLGPFGETKRLFDRFTIDAHVVKTDAGLFLWYAEDNLKPERVGTRVFVDRLLDPYTPACQPVEAVVPTMEEEIFRRNRYGDGVDYYTIEGPFWLTVDGWHYVMYSGACYDNDTYHIGYASAKTDEQDLTKVQYIKHTQNGKFDPLLIRNDFEEGTGHHSVIRYNGDYYAVYHGRDIGSGEGEQRTARICKLHFADGIITARRYPDRV